MAIPDYQTLMLPVLDAASGGPVRLRDLRDGFADSFHLSAGEQVETIPSGKNKLLNRIEWAATYLVHAGLLHRPSRGHVAQTERGRIVWRSKPPKIDNAFLTQFPEFLTFRPQPVSTRTGRKAMPHAGAAEAADATPDEMLEEGYARLREETEASLLERLMAGTPEFFEQTVVDVLVAMGFGGSRVDAARRIGQTGDEGIDGVIDEDALGLDAVYVQAKRWKNNVGGPELQAFVGSLVGKKASKGVFLTTSSFTPAARKYVEGISQRVVLVDGRELVRHMFDRGVGVRTKRTFVVKEVDDSYFEEE